MLKDVRALIILGNEDFSDMHKADFGQDKGLWNI